MLSAEAHCDGPKCKKSQGNRQKKIEDITSWEDV